MEVIDRIKDVLSTRTPRYIQQPSYIHAAVLIPLFIQNGKFKILFTKRTNKVEHHKGQVSFPGGAVDEKDSSLEETVFREAHEEIGLLEQDVEILGRIDDTLTVVSEFIVHPFVGFVPYPYEYTINDAEVEKLIKVPITVFDSRNPECQTDVVEYDGMSIQSLAYEYKGDVIWGATARMMENFMNILGNELPLPGPRK
jgi:8-oxo-dGTP pyrophosphatase MutT (NUDIX family)